MSTKLLSVNCQRSKTDKFILARDEVNDFLVVDDFFGKKQRFTRSLGDCQIHQYIHPPRAERTEKGKTIDV